MTADYISPWDLQRREKLESSRAAFEAHPDFSSVVAEAERRGFRRITLSEQLDPCGSDAYTWRGGVWVKNR